MKKRNIIIGSSIGAAALLSAGTMLYWNQRPSIPQGAQAVEEFNVKKYLGKWFEIARMDFHFEKDLNNTTAEYSLNEDGTVKVVNRGYNYKKYKEVESIGKAKFANSPDKAMLKVSFFGPFYAGYNVIAIDRKYQYALVAGRNLDYLWILSRETTVPDEIINSYLSMAKEIGYDIDKLIWVEHNHYIK